MTSVEALVDDLSDHEDSADAADVASDAGKATRGSDDGEPRPRSGLLSAPQGQAEKLVLCVGGRSALDDAASLLLAQLLQRQGLTARVAGYETLSVAGITRLDPARIGVICLLTSTFRVRRTCASRCAGFAAVFRKRKCSSAAGVRIL